MFMNSLNGRRFGGPGFHTLAMLGILVLAAVLRFHGLDRTGIWLDESYSWYETGLPFGAMYQESAASPHPPLHNFLAWPWVRLFGDSEVALRSLPAMLGTLNVLLLYLTGRLLWGPRIALTGMVLLALSPFHVWYSQEFRPYALLALAATAYMHSVFRILLRKPAALVYNIAAGLALLFSHVFGSFLFAGVSVYLLAERLLRRDIAFDFRRWLAAQALVVAVFGPWAAILLRNSVTARIHWIPELGIYPFFSQLSSLLNGPLAATMLCLLAFYGLFSAFRGYAAGTGPSIAKCSQRMVWALLVIWAGVPLVVTVVLSLAVTPLLINRYLILCLPAVCLLAASGLQCLKDRRPLYIGAILVLAVGLSTEFYRMAQRDRHQYRTVTGQVRACYRPGDLVVVMPSQIIHAVRYYWRDPAVDFLPVDDPLALQPLARESGRIWLIRGKDPITMSKPLTDLDPGHRLTRGPGNFLGVEYHLFSDPSAPGPEAVKRCGFGR